jgi:hypothetical protein
MRLQLTDDSRVFIDLRATGLLKAVAHDPTLSIRPEPLAIEFDEGASGAGRGEASVAVIFRSAALEAPRDIAASDRDKMLENARGRDVLDTARFPTIELDARYTGTLESGTLAGSVRVRGNPHGMSMPIRIARQDAALVATGAWEGRLNDLGIKPFKALLGAIKLEDWVRLRLEARLLRAGTSA